MKRARNRQSPSSCQSCRARKLRCDQVQPCANCVARHEDCVFVVPPQKRQSLPVASADLNIAELRERVQWLEALLLPRNLSGRSQATAPSVSGSPLPPHLRQQEDGDHEIDVLNDIGTNDASLLRSFPDRSLSFIIRPPRVILTSPPNAATGWDIVLPSYNAAVALLDNYLANISHVCRVVHVPTLRSHVHSLYVRLAHGDASIQLDQAALCLSLFALSAYFYPPSKTSIIAGTEKDLVCLSKIWTSAALDVLDYSSRIASGTLLDVQALILLTFVTFHLDGFSPRTRLLHSRAVGVARELRLHRTDAKHRQAPELGPRLLLDLELKRRVFWHLAASDWLNSAISGPQEGTYFFHPSQISVRLPQACSDDEILLGQNALDNPPDGDVAHPERVSMDCFLARVQLAHICREIADTIPLNTTILLTQVPYERIIALDQKLQSFLSTDLPVSLRSDPTTLARTRPLETIWPHLATMRYHIATVAHARRCRLHQKLLLRQAADPRFAFSRIAALESARAILQAYRELQKRGRLRHRQRREDEGVGSTGEAYDDDNDENLPPSLSVARMGIVVHHTHLALVVLVMDLCFNGSAGDHDEVKRDVADAMQTLEGVRHVSRLLGRSLDALRVVLLKHGVHLPSVSTPPPSGAESGALRIVESGDEGLVNDAVPPLPVSPEFLSSGSVDRHHDPLFFLQPGTEAAWPPPTFWEPVMEQSTTDAPDSTTWDDFFLSLDTRPF